MSQDTQKLILKILDLYLSGEHISQKTIDKFQDWFAQESCCEIKYTALEAIFNEMVQGDPKPSKDVEKSFEEFCQKFGIPPIDECVPTNNKRKSSPRFINIWYKVAAVLLPILSAAGGFYYYSSHKNVPESLLADVTTDNVSYSTDSVQVKNYYLPDSSNIWLNGNSEISYQDSLNTNVRHVVMKEGEAYFKVEKQPGRLFVVEVDKLKATVRGTTFSVSALSYKPYVRISLFEGLLDVEYDGQVYNLIAGQELIYTKASGDVEIDQLPGKIPHWMLEEFNFDNITSAEILDRVAKMYNVEIECKDPSLLDEKITVRFEEDIPLDNLLFFLSKMSTKFFCTHSGNTIIVKSQKDQGS